MSRRKIHAGDTSVIVPVYVQDVTSGTGGGLAGLVFNSSGLTCKYKRRGDASYTPVSLVTATVGTWVSGGFKEDTSGQAGDYELHLPNAAVAAGAKWVNVELYGATNMLPIKFDVELDAIDYQDGRRAGLTALPPADALSNGGLPGGDASGRVTVGTNADKAGYALTSAERNAIADAYLDRADGVETGLTPRNAAKIIAAAVAYKLSGAATALVKIRDYNDLLDRITAVVDASGNRVSVTFNLG